MEQILRISEFILKSFLHIWPYLLVTIPLAVMVNLSGAAKHISKVFGKKPLLAVLLATIVGAFSPFCSCGVIPVIASLLIGGVPLAPVMSFWIASPSMDPEIFFLSTSVLGWKLAVWRLASTFLISLSAGYITHFLIKAGFIDNNVLKSQGEQRLNYFMKKQFSEFINLFRPGKKMLLKPVVSAKNSTSEFNACCVVPVNKGTGYRPVSGKVTVREPDSACSCACDKANVPFRIRIINETAKATWLVIKFMLIAFLLTALIEFYIPAKWINVLLEGNGQISVIIATLIGIPAYTSNLTALPMVAGLIGVGMNKGAALAFLIAGATTTLPAMAAVWGIAKPRIFMLYLLFIFFGALTAGIMFNMFNA